MEHLAVYVAIGFAAQMIDGALGMAYGGGSAVDIGLFGRSLFVPDARRALEAGNGELWNIDRPREEP